MQRLALQEEVNTLTGLEQAAQQRADKATNELESTQRRLEVVEEEMSSLTVELESNKELLKVSEMRVATLEAAKARVSRHEQLVAEEEMRLRDEIARLKSVDVQVLHQSDCVL